MWCKRAVSANGVDGGAKFVREYYACRANESLHTYRAVRGPGPVRTRAVWPARSLSSTASNSQQPAESASSESGVSSKLRLLYGDANMFSAGPKPMLGAPVKEELMTLPKLQSQKIKEFSISRYVQDALQPFEAHEAPEAALMILNMSYNDVVEVLEDIVVKCFAASRPAVKGIEDPHHQRDEFKVFSKNRLQSLMEMPSFHNLLKILVHEAPETDSPLLIRVMATLSNFSHEDSISALKPLVERLAMPLKPSMGRLSPTELAAFCHAYAAFQISDPATWKEAMGQMTSRFDLFEPYDLTNMFVAITRAPYLADQVAIHLTKCSSRLLPKLGMFPGDLLVKLAHVVRVSSPQTRDRKAMKPLRQVIISELLSKFRTLPHYLVHECVADDFLSLDKSYGLASALDSYLATHYALWSLDAMSLFVEYMYNAKQTPCTAVLDYLNIKIYDQLKFNEPNTYLGAAATLAQHGGLSQTLSLVMCQTLARSPGSVKKADISHLAKMLQGLKHVGNNPLRDVLRACLASNFADLEYNDLVSCLEVFRNLNAIDQDLIERLDRAMSPNVSNLPLNVKAAIFSFLVSGRSASIPGLEELVDKYAESLVSSTPSWEVSRDLLKPFSGLAEDTQMSEKMLKLRHVIAQSALDHFMATRTFSDAPIEHLNLAVSAFAHDHKRLSADDRDLYQRLLDFVTNLPVVPATASAVAGRTMYRLLDTVYQQLDDSSAEDRGSSLQMKAVLSMLNYPNVYRTLWIADLDTAMLHKTTEIVIDCLQGRPLDLKSWSSSIQVQLSKLTEHLTSRQAIQFLRTLSSIGRLQVQFVSQVVAQFRFHLFVLNADELLVLADGLFKSSFNPDNIFGIVLEHLIPHLNSLSPENLTMVLTMAAAVGADGVPVLKAMPSIISAKSDLLTNNQLLSCMQAFSLAGMCLPGLSNLLVSKNMAWLKESPSTHDKLRICSSAYSLTLVLAALPEEFKQSILECLRDEEVIQLAKSTPPMLHLYATAVLALCQSGHFDDKLLAHVFDENTLPILYALPEGSSSSLPAAVLDIFSDLYDVIRTHPAVSVFVDEGLMDRCGFNARSIKVQELVATAILESNSLNHTEHSGVWPLRLGPLTEEYAKLKDIPADHYSRLLPMSFGCIHILQVRDARGKLQELPEIDPGVSVQELRKHLQDKCEALAEPDSAVYAVFCHVPLELKGMALGRLDLWLSLLEANNIRPLAFDAQKYNMLTSDAQETLTTMLMDKDKLSTMPFFYARKT